MHQRHQLAHLALPQLFGSIARGCADSICTERAYRPAQQPLLRGAACLRCGPAKRLRGANAQQDWYVTAGGAWADIKDDYTITSTLPALTFPSPTGANFSTTKSGWTIGGGVETHLGGNWTVKLVFVDLGILSHRFTTPVTAAGTFGIFDSTHSVQDHIIRVGARAKLTPAWSAVRSPATGRS
jgi:hypothetical protein